MQSMTELCEFIGHYPSASPWNLFNQFTGDLSRLLLTMLPMPWSQLNDPVVDIAFDQGLVINGAPQSKVHGHVLIFFGLWCINKFENETFTSDLAFDTNISHLPTIYWLNKIMYLQTADYETWFNLSPFACQKPSADNLFVRFFLPWYELLKCLFFWIRSSSSAVS